MTNHNIVKNLNSLHAFINAESKLGQALLGPSGAYAINYNRKLLVAAYEPYAETLKTLNDDKDKIAELLSVEVDTSNLRKITADDFKDGITVELMMLIDFMVD